MLRKSLICALGAVIAAGVMFGASGVKAQEITLRLHTLLPPVAAPPKTFLIPWAEKVTKESGGKMKVQFFGAMSLGGAPPQLVDQARDGVVDMVWTLPGYTAGRFPISGVFELPFVFTEPVATTLALQDFKDLWLANEYKDYHVLLLHVHGGSLFMMKTKPITKISDFKGLKIRTATAAGGLFLKSLGATPIGAPVTEIAQMLSKGVVDGVMLPYEIAPSQKLQELGQYFITLSGKQPRMNTSMFSFLMNKNSYAKLPPDMKKVINANSGRNIAKMAGQNWADIEIGGQKVMASKDKNKFMQIPPTEVDKMRIAAQTTINGWVKDMNSKGFDGERLLSDARDLIARYSN